MPGKSAIEWTDRVWNPTTGCHKVSPGCEHCYAERLSLRFGRSKLEWTRPNAHLNVRLHPERLDLPLRWRQPARIFVDSMADLFHELVPDEYIDRVWAVMSLSPGHTFQVLTKRPERMAKYLTTPGLYDRVLDAAIGFRRKWPRLVGVPISDPRKHPHPNIWLGTSVEDQRRAEERIWSLIAAPAAVRFLSCEPLLGPVDLDAWVMGPCPACGKPHTGPYCGDPQPQVINWVIAGGESGPGFRPLDLDWARSLRDQCEAAGVPFFFKQVGGITPKSGGRELDGRTWDGMPA